MHFIKTLTLRMKLQFPPIGGLDMNLDRVDGDRPTSLEKIEEDFLSTRVQLDGLTLDVDLSYFIGVKTLKGCIHC